MTNPIFTLARGTGFALLATLILTSCATKSDKVLIPVATTDPKAHPVDFFVATSRQPDKEPRILFSGNRSDKLNFARFTVSVPEKHKPGKIEWPQRTPANPSRDFCVTSHQPLPQEQAMAALGAKVHKEASGRDVVVMVHGFNNTFAEALMRFTQFTWDSGIKTTPVLFTWPSKGSFLSYGYDRESANYSRDSLEELLVLLGRQESIKSISIVAHSMGNWLTMETLRQMTIRGKPMGKITNVVMAAPDVDVEVFLRQMTCIRAEGSPAKGIGFTVFSTENDRALAASAKFWGNPRLGAIGTKSRYASDLVTAGVDIADVTGEKSDGWIKHDKFSTVPDIALKIGNLIRAGNMKTGTEPDVREQIVGGLANAASTAVKTAGTVATIPLAITSESGRDRLADQIKDTADKVSGKKDGE